MPLAKRASPVTLVFDSQLNESLPFFLGSVLMTFKLSLAELC